MLKKIACKIKFFDLRDLFFFFRSASDANGFQDLSFVDFGFNKIPTKVISGFTLGKDEGFIMARMKGRFNFVLRKFRTKLDQ